MSRRDFISSTQATSYDFISPTRLDLGGRNVLITGAAWEDGVGHATATAFARAGASCIALIDLCAIPKETVDNIEAAAITAGRDRPTIMSFAVDISDLAAVQIM